MPVLRSTVTVVQVSSHGSASHCSKLAARRRSDRARRSTAATVFAEARPFALSGFLHTRRCCPTQLAHKVISTKRVVKMPKAAIPHKPARPGRDVTQIISVRRGEGQSERFIAKFGRVCRRLAARPPPLRFFTTGNVATRRRCPAVRFILLRPL